VKCEINSLNSGFRREFDAVYALPYSLFFTDVSGQTIGLIFKSQEIYW